jgi:hypothetical protein
VVNSIKKLDGVTILRPPEPGVGELHETLVIVELGGKSTLADLAKAIEDAPTAYRPEIVPGVRTVITGKLKPDTTPDAIMEALREAELLEE